MDLDPSAYLAGKGVQVFRANGTEITCHCPFCPDGDPKGKGKLYLNTETWLWDCKRCGERGNRKTLLRHFGDQDDVQYLPGQDPIVRRKVLEDAVEVAAAMLENNDGVLEYLIARGLKATTIRDYKIGYVPKGWSLAQSLPGTYAVADKVASGILRNDGHDFFREKITIPYLQRGSVVQLRAKDQHGKYFTPSGESVRLFNSDRLAGAEDVIITEGEFDCLVLQQVLALSPDPKIRAIAVVGIPGCEALPTGFENLFSQCRRVYVALDPDEHGKKAAIRIKELLGSKARIVELPDDLPKCDWTEYLTTRGKNLGDVLELLGNAAGKRLWSMSDAGAKWRRQRSDSPGVKTGFAELDAWFHPGIEPGDLIIPLAKTGVGKTNFLCSLAYNMRSAPTLFITLEMRAAQIYERMRRNYNFHFPLAEDWEIERAMSNLRIVDENRLAEGAVATLCDEYDAEMGFRPKIVMVDYLGYYAKGCRGTGSYEKTTNAAMALKAEAKDAEVGLIAPHQVNRQAENGKPLEASDARDSGVVEETSDLLLSLYRPADAIEASREQVPSAIVRLGCLKNRKGPIGMATNLAFSAASLVLVDDKTEAARMVAEENRMIWRGDDYEAVRRFRQTTQWPTQQRHLALA